MRQKNWLFATGLACALMQTVAWSDGYRNPPEGAVAIGAAGGFRAFAADANATIQNPANLVDLDSAILQFNATVGYGETEYNGMLGNDKTENPAYFIPGISVAAPFGDGQCALGLSSYIAYGRSVQWGSSSPLAPFGYPYEGSMTVVAITPNFAMRLAENLSVAIGVDAYYGGVSQKQFIAPGILADISAEGTSVGWNAAATWKITDRQRVAATYRSPFKIEYDGDLNITGAPTMGIKAEIEYPTIAALAYGVEFTDRIRAEVNLEWLEFSQYQTLTLETAFPGFPPFPQLLNNTWTFGVGGEWDFSEHWTARSGVLYLQNPTPDSTYSTISPDDNQSVVSFGLGYHDDQHLIDLGYAYGIFNGRIINGSSASPPGKYDYQVHLLTLSYGYKF